MKVHEILSENAAAGSTGGGAVGGFRGRLFGGPVSRRHMINPKKIKKIKYSNRNNWNSKG